MDNKLILKRLPGLLICLILAIVSKKLAVYFPSFGSTSFSIILGIAAGNIITNEELHSKGAIFAEKTLLPIAIMLLGVTLELNQVIEIGFKGVFYVAATMAAVISLSIILCKKLGFSKEFSMLMGAGNAVCGSSAIAASSPVVRAKEDEVGISVAIVNLMGTIFMFILPVLAVKVLKMDNIGTGILIGGILQSIGQVAASSSMVNVEVQTIAMLFKMIRVVFLGLVVMAFSMSLKGNQETTEKKGKKSLPVPGFIIVFFVLSLMVNFNMISGDIATKLEKSSDWLMLVSMAGIGMRIKISKLLQEGPKALIAGLTICIVQIVVSLIGIAVMYS